MGRNPPSKIARPLVLGTSFAFPAIGLERSAGSPMSCPKRGEELSSASCQASGGGSDLGAGEKGPGCQVGWPRVGVSRSHAAGPPSFALPCGHGVKALGLCFPICKVGAPTRRR